MFDLNLSVDSAGKAEPPHSPATSVSSVVDGGGDTSSSNDDAASPGAAVTFNFDIVGDGGCDRDRGLVTQELFPVSRLGEIGEPVSRIVPSRVQVQPQQQQVQHQQPRKSRRGPRSRSSQYRGVTFYRRTGRWESHIWDCGKQVYLGGFDTAHAAARAYDRAALKFRGVDADINFNISDYDEDMKQTMNLSKEEFVHILRRQSTGFSRGSSKYRGVTLHKCGRWEARMGQFLGKKAYDKAAIKCNGREAVTNFELSSYDGETISEPGSSNELDLNLGMSSPSPRESGNAGLFQFHPYNVQTSNMFKLHVEGSPATRSGNPPLKRPLSLPGPKPNYEERADQGRTGTASSHEENWAWQMHDQVRAMPVTVLSAAASSGFSSTGSYPTALNLSFSSFPTNTSQYNHR